MSTRLDWQRSSDTILAAHRRRDVLPLTPFTIVIGARPRSKGNSGRILVRVEFCDGFFFGMRQRLGSDCRESILCPGAAPSSPLTTSQHLMAKYHQGFKLKPKTVWEFSKSLGQLFAKMISSKLANAGTEPRRGSARQARTCDCV